LDEEIARNKEKKTEQYQNDQFAGTFKMTKNKEKRNYQIKKTDREIAYEIIEFKNIFSTYERQIASIRNKYESYFPSFFDKDMYKRKLLTGWSLESAEKESTLDTNLFDIIKKKLRYSKNDNYFYSLEKILEMLKIEVNYEFKLKNFFKDIKEFRNNTEKIDTFDEDDMEELTKLIDIVNYEITFILPKKKEMIKTISYYLSKN